MIIRRVEETPAQAMTMAGAEGVRMRLMVGRGDGAPNFSMRLFEVQPQGHTPLHSHNYEHEVLILEGRGELVQDQAGAARKEIQAGDVVFMPPNEMHQFQNTGAGPLKFMCMVPTTFDCGDGRACTPGS